MTEDISTIIAGTEDQMKKAINHLEAELIKIRAGKANPQMLDSIVVDYYGSPMPINQVANISVYGCPYTNDTALGKKYAAAY